MKCGKSQGACILSEITVHINWLKQYVNVIKMTSVQSTVQGRVSGGSWLVTLTKCNGCETASLVSGAR